MTSAETRGQGPADTEKSQVEAQRLQRFFDKLIGEVLHFGAESVTFSADETNLKVSLKRGQDEIKSIDIRSAWLQVIHQWLRERQAFLFGPESSGGESFTTAMRVGSGIVVASVKLHQALKGPQSIVLTNFKEHALSNGIDMLGPSPLNRRFFAETIDRLPGLVIAAAPDAAQLQKNTAVLLSLTGAQWAGGLNSSSVWDQVKSWVEVEPVLLNIQADDVIGVLLKLRELKFPARHIRLAGIVVQGFAPLNCPGCSRQTPIDRSILAELPAALVPANWENFNVGRGCEECDQRGFKGFVGVQNLVSGSDQITEWLEAGPNEEDWAERLYSLGVKPLLEDGLRRVRDGKVTFDGLFKVTKNAPAIYRKYFGQNVRNPAGPTAIQAKNRPPSTSVTELNEDGPLFDVSGLRKARATPMLLVVEDDADQRGILEMVFRAAGYDVALATHGGEALKFLESSTPDLIVSDLMMPTMDGSELIARLKAHPQYQHIPVLVLTVISDGDKEYALLDMGVDDYCEKTIQRKVLLKRVEHLIKRGRA